MNVNSRIARINFTGYASGAIVSFTGLRAAPAIVKINAIGVSECNVVRCGANVWDEQVELGAWNDTLQKWVPSNLQLKSKNLIPIMPNTTYRLKNPIGTISRYVYYDKDKNYLSWTGATSNASFTTPANAYYMMFGLATTYGTTYNHNISINYPSTDTEYHAYNGNTYTIPANEFTQIDQIIGINNIFSDTGNVEVYYVTI